MLAVRGRVSTFVFVVVTLSFASNATAARHRAVAHPQPSPQDLCRAEKAFDEAETRYGVPSNLLRAVAMAESGCNQNAGIVAAGCGVMQLDGATRTGAVQELIRDGLLPAGSTSDSVCRSDMARLNILGGASVMRDKKCLSRVDLAATPVLMQSLDGSATASTYIAPDASALAQCLTSEQTSLLSQTIESWWFAVVAYNGLGADGYQFTSNYPSRVWRFLPDFIGSLPAYPPLNRMDYLCAESIQQLPNNKKLYEATAPKGPNPVKWSSDELGGGDDAFVPLPRDFGKQPCAGMRWVDPAFDAFTEMPLLHRNDGSVFSVTPGGTVPVITDTTQYQSDGVTVLPRGGATANHTVGFAVTATSTGSDATLRVEIEVRPAGTPFGNAATFTGSGKSGERMFVVTPDLADGSYHWQARVGNAVGWTAWRPFGGSLADFVVGARTLPAPIVTSLTPNPVPGLNAQQSITINGLNFTSGAVVTLRTAGSTYPIPGDRTTVVDTTRIKISANVTDAPAQWTVQVTNPDGQSSAELNFQVVTPVTVTPSITSLSPNPVTGSNSAQPFAINGTNFQSGCTVTLRDLTAGQTFTNRPISSQTSTQIVINPNFTTAAHSWSVEVINPGNASSGQFNFSVVAPVVTPSITSVSPNPVTGSDSAQPFTINGANFQGGCTVTLRDLTAGQTFTNRPISSQTSTQIVINPNFTTAAHSWSVEVINPGNASSGQFNFSVVAPVVTPTINSVSPNPVTGSNSAQPFTINGSNFQSGCSVTLRDLTAGQTFTNRPISSQTSTQIVINPNFTTAAHSWSVEVINPGNASSGQFNFSVVAPVVTPSITSVSPNPVTGSNSAQPFTINGSNFQSGCTVTLRDLTAGQTFTDRPISSQTSTQIVINPNFTTAAHSWSVEVINPGNASSGQFNFSVVAPVVTPSISSVSPNPVTGSNSAQPFTINGSNFQSGCSVTLRDLTAGQTFTNRPISSQTSTQIVINPNFTTAAHSWSVEVINPGNASSGQFNFSVVAPVVTPSITSVSPNPVTGSNSAQPFTINGSNFQSGCSVTLRDLTAGQTFTNRPISSQTSTQIVINPNFTTAVHSWSVEVINPGNASSGQFNFPVH
jgi:hypothetical protein